MRGGVSGCHGKTCCFRDDVLKHFISFPLHEGHEARDELVVFPLRNELVVFSQRKSGEN